MTLTTLDYLQMAKDFTGSCDIATIITAAKEIKQFHEADTAPLPLNIPRCFSDFLPYIRLIHPIKGRIPFQPYRFQEEFAWTLHHYIHEDHNPVSQPLIHNCSRQIGTSIMLSAFVLWFALASSKQRVLFIAPKFAQALEIRDRLVQLLPDLPCTFGGAGAKTPNSTLVFANGSTISFRPMSRQTAGEMTDKHLTVVMDAAFCSYAFDAAFLTAINQKMHQKELMVISSCPNEHQGLFYTLWEAAPVTHKVIHPWTVIEARDEAWMKPYRDQLGETRFQQEFECKFVSNST